MTTHRTDAQRARDTARVRDALRDAPESSDGGIAAELGVDRFVVQRARVALGLPNAKQRRAEGSDRNRSVFCDACDLWRTMRQSAKSISCCGCGALLSLPTYRCSGTRRNGTKCAHLVTSDGDRCTHHKRD